ncbi:RNA polymerase sigma factor SigJ [Nocardioides lijunqiniae]|uniref:RNA polymerase sigma factor SigJ n=1 Tax=Nocardioides lijunqiniae TaxID=2760832 RepID=UPI001877D769|nr:RNA polymerase sigma factor SigJ [Nocardioides lijunqiniae]
MDEDPAETNRDLRAADGPDPGVDVLEERRHLISLAFRMLGTMAEAEDAVQETYVRWYRMSQEERDAIEVAAAWLTRVASRVCLNVLGSARWRRESYAGPWLPEPIPAHAVSGLSATVTDPADQVTLDDSVSTALLVVLESMTAAERVSFVLHDIFAMPFNEIAEIVGRSPAACRQLATSARRRVQQGRDRRVSRAEHDEVVTAFATAARNGDLAGLVAVLDPEVVWRSDGGGVVNAARKPVVGADRVVSFFMGLLTKYPQAAVREQATPDGLGFALWDEGRVIGVVTLEVVGGLISDIRTVMNPHKLTLWN